MDVDDLRRPRTHSNQHSALKNSANRKRVREMECLLCGHVGCDPHHMIRQSKQGTDSMLNLVPLCRKCHDEWHRGNRTVIDQSWVSAHLYWGYLRECGILE